MLPTFHSFPQSEPGDTCPSYQGYQVLTGMYTDKLLLSFSMYFVELRTEQPQCPKVAHLKTENYEDIEDLSLPGT